MDGQFLDSMDIFGLALECREWVKEKSSSQVVNNW